MANYKLSSLLMVFLGALLVTAVTHAQTYKWTDENGRISFTDDPSKVPEKYRDSAVSSQPAHPELLQRDQSQSTSDLAEGLVRRGYASSYEWTQDMSLWIRIPASTAHAKEEYSEMAAKIASHYHRQKGHLICVRFYYGSGKVIANECR